MNMYTQAGIEWFKRRLVKPKFISKTILNIIQLLWNHFPSCVCVCDDANQVCVCMCVRIWKNFLSFCKPREKPHLRIFYNSLCNLWKSGQLWLKSFTSISFSFYYRFLVAKPWMVISFSHSFHDVLFNHFQLEWFNCSRQLFE